MIDEPIIFMQHDAVMVTFYFDTLDCFEYDFLNELVIESFILTSICLN